MPGAPRRSDPSKKISSPYIPGLRRAPFLAYLHFLHFVFVYPPDSLSSPCLACDIFAFVVFCACVCILAFSLSSTYLQFYEHADQSSLRTPQYFPLLTWT